LSVLEKIVSLRGSLPVERESSEKQEVIFDLPRPPTPGTKPFQTIPHPRARRAGFVPGVARGGGG